MSIDSSKKTLSLTQTIKNVFSTWAQKFLAILVMLITVPIITRHFGLELIGIWLLATQFSQHIFLLEFGFNTSLTRFLSRYRAKNDLRSASMYLSTSILFLFIIGLTIIVLSPLVATSFNKIFSFPSELNDQVYWMIIIVTSLTGINLSLRTGMGMLSSKHLFDRIALWESVSLLIRLVLILFCFYFYDPNFIQLALITFLPTLFGSLMTFFDGLKANRDLKLSKDLIKTKVVKRIFSISAASFIITIAAVIVRQSSSMLAGWKIGIDQVATLAFPILIVFAALPFISIGATLMSPVASEMDAKNQQEDFYSLYVIISRYVFSVVTLIIVGLYFLGDFLFDLWLGGPKVDPDSLKEITKNVLIIFSGVALAIPGFILRQVLIAVGKHWNAALGEIIGAIIGILLGYILMVYTSLGTSGMALGISAAFIIRGAGFLTIEASKYFSISFTKITLDSIQIPLTLILLVVIISKFILAVISFNDVHSISYNLLNFGIILCLWIIGFWILIIDINHKQLIKNYIQRTKKNILPK